MLKENENQNQLIERQIQMWSQFSDLLMELDQLTANEMCITFETAFEILMEHDHYEDAKDRIALLRIKRVLKGLQNVFGDVSIIGIRSYINFKQEVQNFSIQQSTSV